MPLLVQVCPRIGMRMHGYRPESYGEGIADVYDEWFGGVGDVAATVSFLDSLVPHRQGRFLELAAGTGRLAIPLADLGHDVTGIDVSTAMLDRLHAADPGRRVRTIHGDMVDDLPAGPFDVVFVAFNSLFMLTDPSRQAACFVAVAARLAPAGAFVVDAFVPWEPPRGGPHFDVRALAADRVVLDFTVTDAIAQTVAGHYVELIDGEAVRLRPHELRWSRVAELDQWAAAAGLAVGERYGDVARADFTDDSSFHISVYRADVGPHSGI
jgi:SAM-dependent methyltransferase